MRCSQKNSTSDFQVAYLFFLHASPAFSKTSTQLHWNRVSKSVSLDTFSLQKETHPISNSNPSCPCAFLSLIVNQAIPTKPNTKKRKEKI